LYRLKIVDKSPKFNLFTYIIKTLKLDYSESRDSLYLALKGFKLSLFRGTLVLDFTRPIPKSPLLLDTRLYSESSPIWTQKSYTLLINKHRISYDGLFIEKKISNFYFEAIYDYRAEVGFIKKSNVLTGKINIRGFIWNSSLEKFIPTPFILEYDINSSFNGNYTIDKDIFRNNSPESVGM
jgi:hypothetical protein